MEVDIIIKVCNETQISKSSNELFFTSIPTSIIHYLEIDLCHLCPVLFECITLNYIIYNITCCKTNQDLCGSSASGHQTKTCWNQDLHGEYAGLKILHWWPANVDMSKWVVYNIEKIEITAVVTLCYKVSSALDLVRDWDLTG